MTATFAFIELSAGSIAILLILGIVLFGKQMPTVGNWLGKTIKSVQDGVRGIENDVSPTTPRRDPAALEVPKPPQRITPTTPNFEDQAAAPPAPPAV